MASSKSPQHAKESFLAEIGAGFFGEYLISQALVTREALNGALDAQKSLKKHMKIGELLVSREAMKAEDLMPALKTYKAGLRIGELLIHEGEIGFLQLLEALDFQQTNGKQLGECLVELGFCSQVVVDEILELQAQNNQT
jgi:hypothetical protein